MTETDTPKSPRKGRRAALWCLAIVTLLVLAIGVTAAWSVGRTINLSPLVRDRVIAAFSDALPNADITFDQISILIEPDWHPRIRLERVDVVPQDGSAILSFSEAETSLSYRSLIRGEIAPRDILLNGVFLDAQRSRDGQVALAFGTAQTGAATTETGRSLDDLERALDEFLTLPQFSRLSLVQVNGMTLRFDDLRAGRGWTIDGGQFLMRREGDDLRMSTNLALLGGRDYVSTVEFSYESQIGDKEARFGVTFEDVPAADISSQSQALTWLEILDAPISGALRFDIDQSGALGPLNASLQIAKGVIQPGGAVRPVPFDSAQGYLTFTPSTQRIDFQELSVQSPWLRARAEGVAHLQDLEDGLPNVLIGQFNFSQLEGNPGALFDNDVSFEQAQIDMRLKLDPFEFSVGEMFLQDQGQALLLSGELATVQDNWVAKVDGTLDQVEVQDALRWWPESAKPNTRRWVAENVTQGQLQDVTFALRTKPGARPNIYLDFDFENADIRYVKTLPIIENAKGHVVMHENRFVAVAKGGTVAPGSGGAIDITGTSFVIPDTRPKGADAIVNVVAQCTVTAGMAMLDKEPLSVASKAGLPIDLAEGQALAEGTIELALRKGLKASDIGFDVTADLMNLRTEHFVPGKVISAPALRLKANPRSVEIAGQGRLGSVPFDARWSTGLGPANDGVSRVEGTVEINEQLIDEFSLGLPQDMVAGSGQGQFSVTIPRGDTPVLEVSSDLVGLRTSVPDIGWSKPAARSGALALTAQLSDPVRVPSIKLSAPGLEAQGSLRLLGEGGLDRAELSNLRVGNWFNGPVALVGRGANRTPGVEITGGWIDLRRTPESSGSGGGNVQGGPIVSRIDRVIVSEGIELTDFQGDFTTVGGLNGNFTGRVNGGAVVNGTVVPQAGRSAVRLTSSDGGGVFRSAGVLQQTYGGDLALTLRPVKAEGQYDGQLFIKNVRIRNAPAMAELLNAISVVGLLDQLGGEGILFTDVESRFRLTPSQITIAQGSAAGPSMGLSMDGYYDLNAHQFDMQGVVSPLYLINAIGRPIARKGEGLFGFNYNLRGSADDPRVSVNPLSVLTPGIFRDIFRRPPPTLDDTGTN